MAGDGQHLIRPMPADFPEFGPTLTLADACRRWKAGQAAVHRWHRENGSTIAPYWCKGRAVRIGEPVPDDFASIAPTMFVKELMARYHVGSKKVRRWLSECEIEAKPIDRAELARKRWEGVPRKASPLNRQPACPRRVWVYTGPKAPMVPQRDLSMLGQAADFLRPRAPVYRCWSTGAANPQGDHFRFGNVVLTPDELIRRAKAKGWEMAL